MKQCTHSFHGVCAMKAFDTYLANHGTVWQTVPCPICRRRVSYHILMNTFIQTCTLDEAKLVLNETNLSTRCHPDLSLLHVAAIAGNIPVAKYLVEKGLDVEDSTCFELTPVYMAAINGKTEMVRYLVEEHRANIHTKNMFGETILDAINHQKHPPTVRYLQELRVVRGDPGDFLVGDKEKCYKVLERLGLSLMTTVPRLPPLGSVRSLR